MSKQLSKALYRGIVRWTKRNADVPFQLRPSDVREVVPPAFVNLKLLDGSALTDSRAVLEIARKCFRVDLSDNDYQQSLEGAFYALRILNTNYAALLNNMREIREDRTNRDTVKYKVGQVFRHAKYNYKGVIYGWDRTCNRDEEWVSTMGVNPHQTFYNCLPDENDCQQLFGGIRLTKYVGEENIIPLNDNERVVHRALDNYYLGYSSTLQRYVPVPALQFQYPDDYESPEGESLLPASEDSNLLLHEEPQVNGDGNNEQGQVKASKL